MKVCNKQPHGSPAEAVAVAEKMQRRYGEVFEAYKCSNCAETWHVGHQRGWTYAWGRELAGSMRSRKGYRKHGPH